MGRLFGNGINQADLVDLLVLIRTNIIGIQTKLDADGGVADTDYHTATTTAPAAINAGIQTSRPKAIHNQGLLVDLLNDMLTKWNATLSKLDLDGTVNGTNFNSLWKVTDVVGNSAIDAIFNSGIYQGAVVRLLNTFIASIAGVNAKLDLDSGVSGTNYASLWNVSDTVVEQGTYSRMTKLAFIFAIGSFFGLQKAHARPTTSGPIFSSSVAYNQNFDLDTGKIDRFSMQATYSSGTISTAQNFSDGVKSSAQLTVVSTLPILSGSIVKTIRISTVTLTFGVEISSTVGTTALLAQNISSAIINSSALSGVVTSTYVGSVVYATATTVGVNAYLTAASTPALSWSSHYFASGKDPDVSIANDTISTTTAHNLVRGQAVLYSTVTSGTAIGGIFAGTTYYVIPTSETVYKLATTAANAGVGTAINLTGTLGGGATWKFTPLAYAATSAGFKWQASNDKINWTDLSTVSFSTITFSASGSTIWDFSFFNYKWLRASFLAPTQGFLNYLLSISAKGDQ